MAQPAKPNDSRPVAVAIVRENEDGSLEALVLQSDDVPNNAGYFLFDWLRNSNDEKAPGHFRLAKLTGPMQRTLHKWFGR